MNGIYRVTTSGFGRQAFRWAACLALAGTASAALSAILPHTRIRGYGSSLGPVHATFQPYLNVSSGCVPFPAVDAAGNVSGGLKNSGSESGDCTRSTGQVYVRQGNYNGRCAIMYAWYFPKDQNVSGPGNLGHRHDWEDIVVWLNTCATYGRISQISYSHHGEYQKVAYNQPGGLALYGTHPKVNYGRHGGLMDHDVSPTGEVGGQQPGVAWTTLSQAARNALNYYNFGNAVVPFKDSEFGKNLAKAN